jgi:hypothetical protein
MCATCLKLQGGDIQGMLARIEDLFFFINGLSTACAKISCRNAWWPYVCVEDVDEGGIALPVNPLRRFLFVAETAGQRRERKSKTQANQTIDCNSAHIFMYRVGCVVCLLESISGGTSKRGSYNVNNALSAMSRIEASKIQ